jgi:hypothetical protein
MVTIYEVATGKPYNVEHIVDAKESVANGFYTFSPPVKKEEPAPTVIPTPKASKPVKKSKSTPAPIEKSAIKKFGKPKNILKKKK